MNTTPDTQNDDSTDRPFGSWLKAVDRLMAAEFAAAFEGEHASRRDWRLLNVVDGTVPARRPLHPHKLHRLVERGWVVADGDGWALTEDGRAAKERLTAVVDEIRAKVSGAASEEDMATTIATLEKIARAFGWDEETPLPRKHRHGFGGRFPRRFGRPFGRDVDPRHGFDHGHGFGHGRDFGPGRGFGHGARHEHGFDPEGGYEAHADAAAHRHGHDRGGHRGHGHGHPGAARLAQRAFERGFDAGFTRGRDA